MVAVFVSLGVPVWRLTRPASAAPVAAIVPDATPAQTLPLEIEVSFSEPPPAGFQIKQIDQILLQGAGPGLNFHGQWTARLPKEGVDLTFEAHWTPDAPQAAVRLSVSFPDGQKIEKTFWARGSLLEIITNPASPGEQPPSS